MPNWLYEVSPWQTALTILVFIEAVALAGLLLVRRFVIPRLYYDGAVHDAVSGTVQAIGVFYGITVGLIAASVWSMNMNASDLVSKEATAIASLYRDLGGYPSPAREELRAELREYTVFIIEEAWPAQKKGRGQVVDRGRRIINAFQSRLFSFEPATPGQTALHTETLKAYNHLLEYRRLRIDAVGSGLSAVMWSVIWVGAIISIGVAYFYKIEDTKLHAILISLMGGFLAIVLFMITINDRPFYGYGGIPSDPYKLVLERLIDMSE